MIGRRVIADVTLTLGPGWSALAGERVREPHEIRERERLAARRRIDARVAQCRLVAERSERVAQRLAPLAERRGDDACEQRRVGDRAAARPPSGTRRATADRPSAPAGTRPAAR